MKNKILLFLLISAGLVACADQTADSGAAEATEADAAEAAKKMYTLTPFAASTEYADATMESMTFENGNFSFGFSNYELGIQTPDAGVKMCANSDKGQHIHLIVNTQPYAAKYTAEFPYEVEDGEHYILAFLSRSYHESIKNGKAHTAQKVTISDNSITEETTVTDPMLFYSRPKGNYVGQANTEKVMLDFFLANTTLGDDYQVKVQINDETHMVDTWQPYYIEGLGMGEHLITLTLVDAEGNRVDTPLNPVSRKFSLMPDPAEEAM